MPDSAHTARRRTQWSLTTMLVLLLALTGIAAYATHRLYQTAEHRYIDEAFPLRGASRDLLLQMLNEETAVRGYLITGSSGSLVPYRQAKPLIATDFARLDELAASNPEIATDVNELRVLVDGLQRYYDRQIALVARGRGGQLQAQSNVLAGKSRFDRFRSVAGSLLDRSQQIVTDARDSQRRTFWSTLALVLATGIGAAVIGAALLGFLPQRMQFLYDREADARRTAERGDRASRALAHVAAAVILLDPDDTIRYWNPAAATTLDLSEPLALGRAATEVVPGFAAIEDALADGGQGAVVPLLKDGVDRWFAVSETRFPEGRVLVLRDVTAEQQLDRARTEFLATASHELRTPLTAVYGAVRTLRRTDRPDEPELTEQLLAMIEQESERLNTIVDQILVSAQLDRRAVHLNHEECDLRELCESIIASANARTNAHLITLDAADGITVDCDPARLRQVLVNVLDNAMKYSPSGSRVDVHVREQGDSAAVEVADEGLGIAADAQGRIFDKFYRADPDMLGGVGGSGLGLYISSELIEQMGGAISVRSELGKGSTFVVRLPRRRRAA